MPFDNPIIKAYVSNYWSNKETNMSGMKLEFSPPSGSHIDLEARRSLFEVLMQQVDFGIEDENVVMSALHNLASSPVDVEFIDHCLEVDPTTRLADLGYQQQVA